MRRHQLDEAFPTLVRYVGLVMVPALIGAGFFGIGLTIIAPGLMAAAGMIGFKWAKGAAENGPKNA